MEKAALSRSSNGQAVWAHFALIRLCLLGRYLFRVSLSLRLQSECRMTLSTDFTFPARVYQFCVNSAQQFCVQLWSFKGAQKVHNEKQFLLVRATFSAYEDYSFYKRAIVWKYKITICNDSFLEKLPYKNSLPCTYARGCLDASCWLECRLLLRMQGSPAT